MMARFLVRNPATGEIEKRPFLYEGPVSAKAWDNYNRAFLKLADGKYFFPEDPMDAYGEGVAAAEEAAKRVAAGLVLQKATPDTYVANAGRLALLHFHTTRVAPLRAEYRAIERRAAEAEERRQISGEIPEGKDVGYAASADATENGAEAQGTTGALTAQQLAEALPGIPGARERRDQAARMINEICEALGEAGDESRGARRSPPTDGEEAVRAFRGYLDADGNFVQAARIARISKTKFYRLWPQWIKAARDIGEKILVTRK